MKQKSTIAAAKTARTKGSQAVVQERLVLHLRSQDGAMEYLRANHPEFFEDATTRNLAAMIVVEMAEELVKLSKVERVSVIATTIGLMYKMGTAAIKSIRDDNRNMAQICVDEYLENVIGQARRGEARI